MIRLSPITISLVFFASSALADFACPDSERFDEIQSEYENQFNRLRQRNSLEKLNFSDKLTTIAADYACVLARSNHFDHVGPDGSTLAERARAGGYRYCSIAENLAKGQPSVSRVLIDWSNSLGHYANLMRQGVVEFGLGLAIANAKGANLDDPILTLSDLAKRARTKLPTQKKPSLPEGDLVWVLLLGREC